MRDGEGEEGPSAGSGTLNGDAAIQAASVPVDVPPPYICVDTDEIFEQMKAECQNLENFIAAKEQDYAKLDEYIREQFVSRLGEELCKPNRIDDLIAIMEEGKAKTVTESVEFYKAPKSK